MKHERLNGLMMLHVHKERLDKQELKNVAAEFSAKNISFRQNAVASRYHVKSLLSINFLLHATG